MSRALRDLENILDQASKSQFDISCKIVNYKAQVKELEKQFTDNLEYVEEIQDAINRLRGPK